MHHALAIAFCSTLTLTASAQSPTQPPQSPTPVVHPVFPTGTSTPLGAQIAALLSGPKVTRAHWGIAVTELDGTPIYGLDEGKLFRPASNAKLFTTTAAMALLGPAHTFDTRIFGKLDPATGVVTGDLILAGGGDANFAGDDLPYVPPALRPKNAPKPPALRDLEMLADQLAAKGVKRIIGNIVGDDSLFPWQPYAEAWGADDLVWGYGAPVSALTIADNELRLTITPGRASGAPGQQTFSAATVVLEQNGGPYYNVQADVSTLPPGTKLAGADVEHVIGTHDLRVFGAIAADAAPDIEHVAIDGPAAYAAMALRNMLLARGITVDGGTNVIHQRAQAGPGFLSQLHAVDAEVASGTAQQRPCMPTTPPAGELLASHTSAPLAQDVTLTLKVSQNLHAELLLHQLGRQGPCSQGSTVAGARAVRSFLLHAGLDPDDYVFYDGSGLSTKDLVTPRAVAQLLAFATKQPWFPQWKSALPVGGQDGTLASRFKDAPLKDHLFAKTGTLGESRALSGYVDCASGKQVIFSVLVDDHTPSGSSDREVMDKIVAAIAANN